MSEPGDIVAGTEAPFPVKNAELIGLNVRADGTMSGDWKILDSGDVVEIEVTSIASGPLLMDCDACGAYHEVGISCEEAWECE